MRRRNSAAAHQQHAGGPGTWKLVFVDFMTVLMVTFGTLWLLSLDARSTSGAEGGGGIPVDAAAQACMDQTADTLKAQQSQEFGPDAASWPIQMDSTPGSLRLTLVDYQAPMFEKGQSGLSEFARQHFKTLGKAISRCPDLWLKVEGYTDALPYSADRENAYGNWELSADRANAARRELIKHGVSGRRFMQVVGYGPSRPVYPTRPDDPRNRRVSITLSVL